MRNKTFKLSNGISIPAVGFGTWQVKDGEEAFQSVLWALNAGYRHIDTAYSRSEEHTSELQSQR